MDEAPDRLIVMLDSKGPVEVIDLTASFAALARLYERRYRHYGEPAPKLYITRLETGSIIAEVAPYAWFLGQAVSAMGATVSIADFTHRLAKGIKTFADPNGPIASDHTLSREDAADLREFTRPLAGKQGATLGIKHARFHQRDGARETVVEYSFDEAEINRATINLNGALESLPSEYEIDPEQESGSILREVILVFEQASRKPGKEKGRTGDRGVISEISPRALPVYFRKSAQNLKDQMVRSELNPLTDKAFVVDVYVTRINGEPKAYMVTEVHAVLPLDSAE